MFRDFALIVSAALGSAVLGAGFGWLIGHFAPEFVVLLAMPNPIESPVRVATALGAIVGLGLGMVSMLVVLVAAAIRNRNDRRP